MPQGVIPSEITFEQIAAQFHLPSEEACVKLGVSLTVLKRICRKHGIERWPFRRVKSLNSQLKSGAGLSGCGSLPVTPRSGPSYSSSSRIGGAFPSFSNIAAMAASPRASPAAAAQLQAAVWRMYEAESGQSAGTGTTLHATALAAAAAAAPSTSVPQRAPSTTTSGIDMLLCAAGVEPQQNGQHQGGGDQEAEAAERVGSGGGEQEAAPDAGIPATPAAPPAPEGPVPYTAAGATTAPRCRGMSIKQRLMAHWIELQQQQQQQQQQPAVLPPAQLAAAPAGSGPSHFHADVAMSPHEAAAAVVAAQQLNASIAAQQQLLPPPQQASGTSEGEGESGGDANMDRLPTFRGWQHITEWDRSPSPARAAASDFSFGGLQQGQSAPPPAQHPPVQLPPAQQTPMLQPQQPRALPLGRSPFDPVSPPASPRPPLHPNLPAQAALQQQQAAPSQPANVAHAFAAAAARAGYELHPSARTMLPSVFDQLVQPAQAQQPQRAAKREAGFAAAGEGGVPPGKRVRAGHIGEGAAAALASHSGTAPEVLALQALLQNVAAALAAAPPSALAAAAATLPAAPPAPAPAPLFAVGPATQQQQQLLLAGPHAPAPAPVFAVGPAAQQQQQQQPVLEPSQQLQVLRRLSQDIALARLAEALQAAGGPQPPEDCPPVPPLPQLLLPQQPAAAAQQAPAQQAPRQPQGGATRQRVPPELAERALRFYASRLGFDVATLQLRGGADQRF
eukprot:scaffold7.g3443.t1